MYRDKTLIPTEAIRLCALGLLASGPRRYGELAVEVRHFASHILGPSLDVLGPSLELLRHEGLVVPVDGAEDGPDGPMLELTEPGRAEFFELLRAGVRSPVDDVNKLVLALKFRFLHLLAPDQAREQIVDLVDLHDVELARLAELHKQSGAEPGHLGDWLGHDIAQIEARIAWLGEFRKQL